MDFIQQIIDWITTAIQLKTSHSDYSNSGKAVHQTLNEAQQSVADLAPSAPPPQQVAPTIIVPQRKKFGLPGENIVTSNFGNRILFGGKQWHPGIDLSVFNNSYGAPVKAPEDGVVILNKQVPEQGNLTFVAITGDYSRCHLYLCHTGSKDSKISPLVQVGQRVKCGDVVGYSNPTGMITGPHTHLGCYTPKWVLIDPGLYYKKFAPDVFATLRGYQFSGELDPSNKTGSPSADL